MPNYMFIGSFKARGNVAMWTKIVNLSKKYQLPVNIHQLVGVLTDIARIMSDENNRDFRFFVKFFQV